MKYRVLATAALVAIAGIACAGIIYVPVGGLIVDLDTTPVQVREQGNQIRVETTGLTSQLDCVDQPPDETFVLLTQNLRLRFDQRDGKVSGTVLGSMDKASAQLALRGGIDGEASCFPTGSDDCGAMVVDLTVRNRLVDVSDPTLPELLLDQRLLGSLQRNGRFARWVRMDADLRLGGPEDVVATVIESMEAGDSCGN
ncbi:MAG: hypothetical protein QNJ40_25675 [Xanthomonadales bacterium]|nr:hypothetical protein [Xanthomonadales bacterium]